MATNPYMPLYIGDYIKVTGHLGAAEHGAYLLLIMQHWTTQAPLPDNDKQLARIARMDLAEWIEARPVIQPFFEVRADGWVHDRVLKELEAAKTRSIKAKQKADKRWGLSDITSDATACTQHPPSIELVSVSDIPQECSSLSYLPSEESNPLPPTEVAPPKPKLAFRLPDDWEPAGGDLEWAAENQIAEAWRLRQTEMFKNHFWSAGGHTARKLDWSKAWKVWLLRDLPTIGLGQPPPSDTTAALAATRARMQALDEARCPSPMEPLPRPKLVSN